MLKNKAFLLVLCIIGVLLYISFGFESLDVGDVVISMTEDGFYPTKITVPIDTTVTWTNEGGKLHWPASNPHPKHTGYPEKGGCSNSSLDACRGLSKNETYSFQFNFLGSWGVHDHLFPGNAMVVIVRDSNSSSFSSVQKSSTDTLLKNLNYAEQIEKIRSMSKEDPALTWEYLKENFITDEGVVDNAHEFAHIVGHATFEKFGLDGLKICDESFAFGCFHGVTEKMLLKEGLKNIKYIEEKCLQIFPPNQSHNYTSCIHGTGHGVYSFEGGNVKKSLSNCDLISKPHQQYCYDGVFMENVSAEIIKKFDEKNPWEFCVNLNEKYHHNCARYQSEVFIRESGFDNVGLTGKYCESTTSRVLKETCLESLGYYVAQQTTGELKKIIQTCGKISSKDGASICIMGGAIETTFQKYAGFKNTSPKLCKELPQIIQTTCLDSVNNLMKNNFVSD